MRSGHSTPNGTTQNSRQNQMGGVAGGSQQLLRMYREVRDAPCATKLAFADASLRIFAQRDAGEFSDWVDAHPGHRRWFPLACRLLLGDVTQREREAFAAHVAIVDVFKHATPNASHLEELSVRFPLLENCPSVWLEKQIQLLEPSLLVLCGSAVTKTAMKLWTPVPRGSLPVRFKQGEVHGHRWSVKIGSRTVDAITSFAIAARPGAFHWPSAAHVDGTESVQSAMWEAIRRRASSEKGDEGWPRG